MRELTETLAAVKRCGYDHCFEYRTALAAGLNPEGLEVVDTIQLDAGTDPGDDVTVFLLKARNGVRGYMLVPDSFHTDPIKADFIDRLLRSGSKADAV